MLTILELKYFLKLKKIKLFKKYFIKWRSCRKTIIIAWGGKNGFLNLKNDRMEKREEK